MRADFDQPVAVVTQTRSPSVAPSQCSAWVRWRGQVALGVDGAARLARGPRGEDDQGGLARVEVGDRGRGRLRAVLVEDGVDVGHRHRLDAAGQRLEQLLLADAEREAADAGVGADRLGPQLEVAPAQLRVAGERDRAHPPAGEQRQHPLDPVAGQGHDDVAAADAARREGAGEPRRARDQLAEVPDAPLAVARDRDQCRLRGRVAVEEVSDQIHEGGTLSAARPW